MSSNNFFILISVLKDFKKRVLLIKEELELLDLSIRYVSKLTRPDSLVVNYIDNKDGYQQYSFIFESILDIIKITKENVDKLIKEINCDFNFIEILLTKNNLIELSYFNYDTLSLFFLSNFKKYYKYSGSEEYDKFLSLILFKRIEIHDNILKQILDNVSLIQVAFVQRLETLPKHYYIPPRINKREWEKMYINLHSIFHVYKTETMRLADKIFSSIQEPPQTLLSLEYTDASNFDKSWYGEVYLFKCPSWFLDLPKYFMTLVHEITHGLIPKPFIPENVIKSNINRDYEDLKRNISNCLIELRNIYYRYTNLLQFSPKIAEDVFEELLADLFSCLISGPYYIFSFFFMLSGKVKFNKDIGIGLNPYVRIIVLKAIIDEMIKYANNKEHIMFFNKEDFDCIENLSFYFIEFFNWKDATKIFTDQKSVSYKYLFLKSQINVLTFYFKKIIRNIINILKGSNVSYFNLRYKNSLSNEIVLHMFSNFCDEFGENDFSKLIFSNKLNDKITFTSYDNNIYSEIKSKDNEVYFNNMSQEITNLITYLYVNNERNNFNKYLNNTPNVSLWDRFGEVRRYYYLMEFISDSYQCVQEINISKDLVTKEDVLDPYIFINFNFKQIYSFLFVKLIWSKKAGDQWIKFLEIENLKDEGIDLEKSKIFYSMGFYDFLIMEGLYYEKENISGRGEPKFLESIAGYNGDKDKIIIDEEEKKKGEIKNSIYIDQRTYRKIDLNIKKDNYKIENENYIYSLIHIRFTKNLYGDHSKVVESKNFKSTVNRVSVDVIKRELKYVNYHGLETNLNNNISVIIDNLLRCYFDEKYYDVCLEEAYTSLGWDDLLLIIKISNLENFRNTAKYITKDLLKENNNELSIEFTETYLILDRNMYLDISKKSKITFENDSIPDFLLEHPMKYRLFTTNGRFNKKKKNEGEIINKIPFYLSYDNKFAIYGSYIAGTEDIQIEWFYNNLNDINFISHSFIEGLQYLRNKLPFRMINTVTNLDLGIEDKDT